MIDRKVLHLDELILGPKHGQHVQLTPDGIRLHNGHRSLAAWITTAKELVRNNIDN
jgi:hypothetical protein